MYDKWAAAVQDLSSTAPTVASLLLILLSKLVFRAWHRLSLEWKFDMKRGGRSFGFRRD
jgi:hypothetical protein